MQLQKNRDGTYAVLQLLVKCSFGLKNRPGIIAGLNSVELYRNRIYLGGPIFCGLRMSKNIRPVF